MKKVKHTDRAHAKLSASGSDKWLNCPGSVAAEASYPNSSSEYAEEGTLAHELADLTLKSKHNDAQTYVDMTLKMLKIGVGLKTIGDDEKITLNMANHVQEYVDYVKAHETNNTQLFTEEKVDFSNVVPEGFGTMDSAVLDYETKICHIFDLKYGQGVPVYAENNNQGKMYAIGLYNELSWLGEIKSFRIHICQPRINNFSSWDITVEDLIKFSKHVKERAVLALSEDAPRVPGTKQCQWCKAKGNCEALYNFTQKTITEDFDFIDDGEKLSGKLSDSQKRSVLDNRDLIEEFLKAVEAEVYNRLIDGRDFDGYKLVRGRSNRVLVADAETKIVAILGEKDSYDKKLIGIGDLETKLKGKLGEDFKIKTIAEDGTEITTTVMDKLTNKPEGKLTLAPVSDKRPAVNVKPIEDDFEDISNET